MRVCTRECERAHARVCDDNETNKNGTSTKYPSTAGHNDGGTQRDKRRHRKTADAVPHTVVCLYVPRTFLISVNLTSGCDPLSFIRFFF